MKDLRDAIKETNKNIGGIGESNGAMAEELIYNSLKQSMVFAGIQFYDIGSLKKDNTALKLERQYDIVLTNGDTIAIIEAKFKVRKKDVIELATEKLNDFRKLYPMYNNYKIVLGIGGLSFEKYSIEEAKENGIGIIKIVGDKIEFHTEGIKIF
jgi:hypothetical protein